MFRLISENLNEAEIAKLMEKLNIKMSDVRKIAKRYIERHRLLNNKMIGLAMQSAAK